MALAEGAAHDVRSYRMAIWVSRRHGGADEFVLWPRGHRAAPPGQYDEQQMADPAVLGFIERISAYEHEDLEAMGAPFRRACRLELTTRDGPGIATKGWLAGAALKMQWGTLKSCANLPPTCAGYCPMRPRQDCAKLSWNWINLVTPEICRHCFGWPPQISIAART